MNRNKVSLIALVAAVAMIAGYSYWIADSDSRSIVISGVIEADGCGSCYAAQRLVVRRAVNLVVHRRGDRIHSV